MEKKLEVKNLQISFRTQNGNVKAVRDISFDLYKGETLAIVGESGSGKSVTSKAIIGILANNSIVEGGEILYDGQDLLKITEEDFHKIRGDKISMIFQDPMSSLNPIMKVGQQMTEAMITKGKASQKNSRRAFNTLLANLNKFMDANNPNEIEKNKEKCNVFNKFCIAGLQNEANYNEAMNHVVSLQLLLEETLFLIEKEQKVDINKVCRTIKKETPKTVYSHLISKEEADDVISKTTDILLSKDKNKEKVVEVFSGIKNVFDNASNRKPINYFLLGYVLYKDPNFDYHTMRASEIDAYCREIADKEFIIDFLKDIADAALYSHKQSIENKKKILSYIDDVSNLVSNENITLKESLEGTKQLREDVSKAIDVLEIVKNSTEYCFESALINAINTYYNGIVENPKAQAKFEKDTEKYNKLVAANKRPTWKVIPPIIVDLELAKSNISKIINKLKENYIHQIELDESYDSQKKSIEIIDFLKEQASLYAYKVTKKIAKARAIKLLKEVGIPEPEIRYNQYPFQFSGGMRQRIVIAIALSANPDILICDEPTTALDVTIQSQILELINDIKEKRKLSVIFITHDLGVVAMMADRIAVMYAGKIVEYGTSEDIFYDPRHPYTWALLSSMPDLDTKEKLEAIPGTPPNMIYPPKGDAFAERNKYALDIDFELQPPLFEVPGSETHFAATWLLHPNAPKVEMPKIITERIERMKKAGE